MQEIVEVAPTGRLHLHHPNIVLRIAGLPFSMANRLATGDSHELLLRLEAMRFAVGDGVQRACSHLEGAIGSSEFAQDERRQLLKLKRALFNSQSHDLSVLSNILDRLPANASADIAGASVAIKEIIDLDAAFEATFARESNEASARLRSLSLESEEFLRGLAFAAPVVAADLLDSVKRPEKFTGKDGRRLDLGLFNYFIRAVAKVSPMTYFTPVLIGRFTEKQNAAPVSLGDREVRSHVELNRYALNYLLCGISKDLRFWGDAHPLILNPTLRNDGPLLTFLDIWAEGPSDGRVWGVQKPLARLPQNARIAALRQLYGAPELDRSFTLGELFAELGDHVFGGDRETFAAYVAQGLRVGLLLPKLDVYEQEDDARNLLETLRARAPEAAQAMEGLLDNLARYSSSSHAERVPRMKAIGEQYAAVCTKLEIGQGGENKSPVFVEDCSLSGPPIDVPTATMGSTLDDLHRLSAIMPLLDNNHVIQSVIASLFVRRYGVDGVVNAMECLESISSEASSMARQLWVLPLDQQLAQIEPLSGAAAALLREKHVFLAALYERLQSSDDVVLDDAFLIKSAQEIPTVVRDRPTSYTVIGQFDESDTSQRFVLNRLYSGHSMLMSRFLSHLDESGLRRVSTYLSKVSAGHKMIELPGVFGFNVNLHPQLVDAELTLSGRHASYRNTEKIDLASLSIRYDREVDRLAVVGPDGDPYSVHYFGFLNIMALPSNFQMLGRINLQGLIPDIWQNLYFSGYFDSKVVTRLARMRYRSVVLSRRTLILPASSLPGTDLSSAAFFREFHSLLRRFEIFDDQYVRLAPQVADFVADNDSRERISSTAYKPTLFSFDMPTSVTGLQRRLDRKLRPLIMQEALPNVGRGGVAWRGESHAHEVQFEVSQIPNRLASSTCQ
ncbi:MAG: lantibiotic dehydratase [Vulcanimicrobiaceae bacterium]